VVLAVPRDMRPVTEGKECAGP